MPQKVFLYSDDVADKDMKAFFKKKDYTAVALTDDPQTFWTAIETVEKDGYIAVLSHGDEHGPLMVNGTTGAEMTDTQIQSLGSTLLKSNVTLYLLSCHTGLDPFLNKMTATKSQFVAPLGYAQTRSSSAGTYVYSVKTEKGDTYAGWAGSADLVPSRNTKPLNIA